MSKPPSLYSMASKRHRRADTVKAILEANEAEWLGWSVKPNRKDVTEREAGEVIQMADGTRVRAGYLTDADTNRIVELVLVPATPGKPSNTTRQLPLLRAA